MEKEIRPDASILTSQAAMSNRKKPMKQMTLKVPESCPDSENSTQFHQGMIDRMAVSFHKYGAVADAKGKIDQIKSLQLRLDKYLKTGNTEWLIDVANMAMIEFIHRGPRAFKPTDYRQSPGRVWCPDEFDGTVETSQRANDGTPQ